mgnify:CR=1 FL=1
MSSDIFLDPRTCSAMTASRATLNRPVFAMPARIAKPTPDTFELCKRLFLH